MIFTPENARAVLDGRKTVTRRPRVDGKPCRYVPGRTYAVQMGRNKPGVGARIRVLHVRDEILHGAHDLREARREGFASFREFLAAWTAIHGRYDPLAPVWRIEFELADTTERSS